MIDRKLLKMMMQAELSDLIFNQHMKSYMPLNIIMLSTQTIILITTTIIDVFTGLHLSRYGCAINLTLCLMVIANNMIHSHTWKKAKERAKLIDTGIDILENINESEELEEKFIEVAKTICPSLYFNKANSNKNKV